MSWINFLGRSWQLLATLSSCSPSKPVLGLSQPEINAHFDDRFGKDRRLFTKLHFPLFKDILGVGQCSSWWIKPSMWFGHLYNWSPPYLFLPFYWAVALFWRFIILAVWSASLVPSDMFEHFFRKYFVFYYFTQKDRLWVGCSVWNFESEFRSRQLILGLEYHTRC